MTFIRKLIFVAAIGAFALGCGASPEAEGQEHHEDHDEHPSEVTLTDQGVRRAGIQLAAASRTLIGGGFWVPAEVQTDPAFTAHVAALTASRVVRVEVAIGDRVERGQRLAVTASREVGEARGAVGAARVRRDAARLARDRQTQLVESGIGARRALQEAEAELASAEAELRGLSGGLAVSGRGAGAESQITAPIAGVIIERHAVVGEVVDALATLFVIADPAQLWVVGEVPELDLSLANLNAPIALTVSAFPDAQWLGHLSFIAPALDAHTRTLQVRATLDAPSSELRAGLFGRLAIAHAGASPDALTIPREALTRIDGEDAVFVPAGEPNTSPRGEPANTYRPQLVRIGRRDRGLVEVLEGLDEGQQVVVHGAFTLKSELSRGEIAAHED